MIAVDLDSGDTEVLAGGEEAGIDARLVSVARPFEYATTGGKTAHALVYAPHNPDYTGARRRAPAAARARARRSDRPRHLAPGP